MGIITTRGLSGPNVDPVAPRCRACGNHSASGLLVMNVCSDGCPDAAAPEAEPEVVIDAVEPEGDIIRAKQAKAAEVAEPEEEELAKPLIVAGDPLTPVKGRNAGKQWSPKPTPQR